VEVTIASCSVVRATTRGAEQTTMLSGQDPRLATITVEGHLTLSATINWHLSARKIDLRALLRVILGPAKVPDQSPLLEALNYLHHAYGDRRRKNGPAAVLHCLRIAAMLARVMPSPTTLDLLGAFLHDKEEDLTREELGSAEWDRVQSEFVRVLEKIDSNHRWFLGERIALLWRQSSQSYYDYVGTVLSKVRTMPDLLRCKLADRLDNTLDIAVQRTPTEQNAFFELAFSMLFLPPMWKRACYSSPSFSRTSCS
jgi:(p)ppGpp synthase/HD superfamily hydrolase